MKSPTLIALSALALLAAGCATPRAPAAAQPSQKAATRQAGCLTRTGSAVPQSAGCVPAPGTVLTRDDIDRTAARDLGDALRQVPSVGIRR